MTDVTQTPAPDLATEQALRGALATVQADYAKHQADYAKLKSETEIVAKGATASQVALSDAMRERDALKSQVDTLTPRAKEADELKTVVDDFRGKALLAALKPKLPNFDEPVIHQMLRGFAEQGKANRFPVDAAAEVDKLMPLFESEAPNLTRLATSVSGSSAVKPTPPKPLYRGPFAK